MLRVTFSKVNSFVKFTNLKKPFVRSLMNGLEVSTFSYENNISCKTEYECPECFSNMKISEKVMTKMEDLLGRHQDLFMALSILKNISIYT